MLIVLQPLHFKIGYFGYPPEIISTQQLHFKQCMKKMFSPEEDVGEEKKQHQWRKNEPAMNKLHKQHETYNDKISLTRSFKQI